VLYNVGDLKYIRYVKEIPIRNQSLLTIHKNEEIRNSLDFDDQNNTRNEILTNIITEISKKYKSISQFQMESTSKILSNLKNRNNTAKGITLVADTGAGKSLAFQLPLVLWIIYKKINRFFQSKKSNLSLTKNCSALLIFPRNVLARDQFESFVELKDLINDKIESTVSDGSLSEYLKISVDRDFGGTLLPQKKTNLSV